MEDVFYLKEGEEVGDYILGSLIAVGSEECRIHFAFHPQKKQTYIAKVMEKKSADRIKMVKRESGIMKLLEAHPNIVKVVDVVETFCHMAIIMEYAPGGDLRREINLNGRLSEEKARKIMIQIISAVCYAHSLNFAHRDIKLENIFLDVEGTALLGDWGFSVAYKPKQKLKRSCGTLFYLAPEIVLGQSYNPSSSDVWSLGVVLFSMVAGELPFCCKSSNERNRDMCTKKKITNIQWTETESMSDELKDLLEKIFTPPEERITLQDLAVHPWLKAENFLALNPSPTQITTSTPISETSSSQVKHQEICKSSEPAKCLPNDPPTSSMSDIGFLF